MTAPRVSIIIPYFNYGQYISECLASVVAQTYGDWECLVVDDCSDEANTNLLYGAIMEQSTPNKVHTFRHRKNRGYSATKNSGAVVAEGEFVRLIDADDVLTPNALQVAVDAFDANPEVDLVHGYADRWYGGNDFRGVNKKTYCHAQGRMWRRTVYDRFGLYYEPLRSMGDKEFIYRLGVHPDSPLPRLVKDHKLKKVVAHYRKHEDQMHKVRRKDEKKNAKLKKQFKRRIKQLKSEGITRENTRFPNG